MLLANVPTSETPLGCEFIVAVTFSVTAAAFRKTNSLVFATTTTIH